MEFPRDKLLSLAFVFEGIAVIAALLLASYFEIHLFPLTMNPLRDILNGTLGAVPPLALFLFTVSKRGKNIPLLGSLRKTVFTELKPIFSDARFLDLVIISLLAGFAEELLFRGIIQVRFGIIPASILFGLVHFISPAYAIITMIMGFYIGIFFHVYGTLLIPIQLHFIYDLGALVYLKNFVVAEYH